MQQQHQRHFVGKPFKKQLWCESTMQGGATLLREHNAWILSLPVHAAKTGLPYWQIQTGLQNAPLCAWVTYA